MNKEYTAAGIAWRIWILTAVFFALGLYGFVLQYEREMLLAGAFILFATIIGSIPAFVLIFVFSYLIKISAGSWQSKFLRLLLLQFFITICYGLFAAVIDVPVGNYRPREL